MTKASNNSSNQASGASGPENPAEAHDTGSTERRLGAVDRRQAAMDRRNEDRLNQDFEPRRNPEIPDRRQAS